MQYGFVIDQNACIGCHACTVACKAENDVPVGSFRTAVKYTEQGRYPEVKRHFLVQRCNHCRDAPCVTICPVNALIKRDDGIVDVDRDACIGCRACMQACPYDALYLNDDHGAVEKCHFCAHRVEVGLEPACVTVCPVGAIIPGDLDDEQSRAARIVADGETTTRRPEQKTGPNVHYVGADDVSLRPGTAKRPPTYLWSDRPDDKPDAWPSSVPTEPDATVVLDSAHRIEWGWPIAIYLVTKGIAAGVGVLAPFSGMRWLPECLAIFFTVLTVGLLVEDLARPWRFYRLLTRPNWNSWLVKGGVLLGVYGVLSALILALRAAGGEAAADLLRWVNVPFGAGVACYTALLFWQCRGRDLWETRLLLPHLLFQALAAGGACLILLDTNHPGLQAATTVGLAGHGLLALVELLRPHATDNARQAAGFLGTIRLGPINPFRESLVLGVGVGIGLTWALPGLAFIPVLAGLLLYEHAFVRAGQLPPLS